MCYTCWTEFGHVSKATPRVIAMAQRVRAHEEAHPSGGHLHIVTEDWNLEASHVRWCEKQARRGFRHAIGSTVFERAPDPVQHKLARDLRRMTLRDRVAALALAADFYTVEP